MRITGKASMSLGLAALSAWAVITALKWPMETALFPIVIGIPVICLALIDFLLCLQEGRGEPAVSRQTVDYKLSEDVDPTAARQRTLITFAWIIGFFIIVLLLGFPLAIPLFLFSYLRIQSGEKWGLSLVLALATWVIFTLLFVHLLNVPFSEGWLLRSINE